LDHRVENKIQHDLEQQFDFAIQHKFQDKRGGLGFSK
jgi:hypothetical protein